MCNRSFLPAALIGTVMVSSAGAAASIRFTEFVYNSHYQPGGNKASFLELTNVGDTAQDMTGHNVLVNVPGTNNSSFSLSSLGSIASGESFLLTPASAGLFRANWNIPTTTKVLSDPEFSIPSQFDFKLYSGPIDLADDQVNLVTHFELGLIGAPGQSSDGNGNQVTAGKYISVNVPLADLGAGGDYINGVWHTVASSIGDRFGSFASVQSPLDIGNPGLYIVPEPSSLTLCAIGGLTILRRRRRSA